MADAPPEQCDHCLNALTMEPVARPAPNLTAQRRVERSVSVNDPVPESVEIMYLTTSQSETVPFSGEVVVGREAAGAAVLSHVPQVSRRHCRLRWTDGILVVQDLGSMHGTRVGPSRIDCREPQIVQSGEVLYLGREPVRVLTHAAEPPPVATGPSSHEEPDPPPAAPSVYYCVSCGEQSDAPIGLCADCGTMN